MRLRKRAIVIVLACAALAAWLSAAMVPLYPPASTAVRAPAAPPINGVALAQEIAKLHERLRPDSAPRPQSRNLFAFRVEPRVSIAAPAPVAPAVPIAAPAPERFALTLAGMAEDPAPGSEPGGQVVRTAIISGRGQLFFAKEGDTIVDRDTPYTVRTVAADGVVLVDRDGAVRRLTLP